jgi:hypothetical protein
VLCSISSPHFKNTTWWSRTPFFITICAACDSGGMEIIMLKRYSQYFEECMFDRTGEIEQEIYSNNQRYQELNTEICEVQQALTDNLSPQLQSLVDRYYDAENEQDCIVSETMYRQGLIDGIKLTGMIHKFFGKWLPSE